MKLRSLDTTEELIVDLFAGGGGASTGIEMALGRHVDIAVNHAAEAVSQHKANHPKTEHFCCDVFEVNPVAVTKGRPVGLLWASPDCKHFSKAKGGKPVSKKIRGLAWVVVAWAKKVKPRIICLENVEEFQTWGPLVGDQPCPLRKGETFKKWVATLKDLGYTVEWRELRACDYGAPTIRKRLFLVARRDGQPIVWPEQTHSKIGTTGGVLQSWKTAASCIDWTLPCPSIFERKKPLADATCKRVAKGLMRYVVDNQQPFIVSIANWSSESIRAGAEPLSTVTANPKGGHHALVVAFLAKHYTGVVDRPMSHPTGTVTTVDHHSLVTSHLVKLRNNQYGQGVDEPVPTLTAGGGHVGEVRSFLVKYYGNEKDDASLKESTTTIPTPDRLGLVMVYGQPYQIVDIGFRMLAPRELYKAQGFPDNYIIDRGADGESFTKTAQVRMCGNSVSPPIAAALISANAMDLRRSKARASRQLV